MSRITRRKFVQTSLAAGALFTISGTKSSGRILGANEVIRVGVAGLNGRGGSHVDGFAGRKGVQVTYLIDPDRRTWASKAKTVKDKGGNEPKTVPDVRAALEDKNLDALTIATPNHWHSLMTIWACQAGKDVYVEKPSSHNVHEGRVAVEAARKYDRIVQHGTQSRSDANWAKVVAVIASGQLGKLKVARALCYKKRPSIGFKPEGMPPAEVDFNLWLGPAQNQPFHANLVHYNWHWFWNFGNGDIGNQGVHQMDIARWGIPGATLPESVFSIGGRFGYKDQGETANTQITLMNFGQTQLIFEVRGLPGKGYRGQTVGNVFHLEAGTIAGHQFFPMGSDTPTELPKMEIPRTPGGGDHFGNFVEAIRSRRKEDLNAEILDGHYSSALCHLANISYRLGKEIPFSKKEKLTAGNAEMAESFERMEEHLARENGLSLGDWPCRLGRALKVNAEAENFSNDSEANALLTRTYRAPFTVPEKIA